jgi:hypothetical protein
MHPSSLLYNHPLGPCLTLQRLLSVLIRGFAAMTAFRQNVSSVYPGRQQPRKVLLLTILLITFCISSLWISVPFFPADFFHSTMNSDQKHEDQLAEVSSMKTDPKIHRISVIGGQENKDERASVFGTAQTTAKQSSIVSNDIYLSRWIVLPMSLSLATLPWQIFGLDSRSTHFFI